MKKKVLDIYEAADHARKEEMRQEAKEKAIQKCLKEQVFTFVCNAFDEDEMEPIMDECTYEELKNIN